MKLGNMARRPNRLSMLVIGLMLLAEVAVQPAHAGAILKICGQNLLNYYWNYNQSERPSYNNDAGRAAKTKAIVNAMLKINADIYAFNELEATEIILTQLADSLTKYGNATYAAVIDNISYTPDNYDNHLRSGFIYATDKVRPYGSNTAASSATYYRNVMRIQTFEDILSGERFMLSMNHFKARSDGDNESDRVSNAQDLLNALTSLNNDPDILVMGDLNNVAGSESQNLLVAAGFEEQTLKYTPNAYSYIYKGKKELIDHVYANSTMAEQVTDAWVENVCSSNRKAYSDHDPYVVTLDLSPEEQRNSGKYVYKESFASSMGRFTIKNTTGSNKWGIKNQAALMNGYNSGQNEDWLISPDLDLTQKTEATIVFGHSVDYGLIENWGDHLKLLISADYDNDPAAATWTELPIVFPGKKKYWTTVSVSLPQEFIGKQINVAFQYTTTSNKNDIPAWSVKNFKFTAIGQVSTAIKDMAAEPKPKARKIIVNGRYYIQTPDGKLYTITGTELK